MLRAVHIDRSRVHYSPSISASTYPCLDNVADASSDSGYDRVRDVISVPNDLVFWHQRLGHVSIHKLKTLLGFDPRVAPSISDFFSLPFC